MKQFLHFYVFFFTLFFFLQILNYNIFFSDPDVSWHLLFGKTLFENEKFLKTNIWSFNQSDITWYNISWLWDYFGWIIYKYNPFTFVTLIIIQNCITILIAISITKKYSIFLPSTIIAYIFSILCFSIFVSARPHSTGIFLAILFLYILLLAREKPKLYAFIPILLLIWINTHGSFLLGYIFLGVFFIEEILTKSKNLKTISLCFLLCIPLILINPYGYHIITATFLSINGNMNQIINEWQPLTIKDYPLFSIFTTLTTIGIITGIKKISVAYSLLTLGIIFQTFQSIRYGMFLSVIALPYCVLGIDFLFSKFSKHPEKTRFYFQSILQNKIFNLFVFSSILLASIYSYSNFDPKDFKPFSNEFPHKEAKCILKEYSNL